MDTQLILSQQQLIEQAFLSAINYQDYSQQMLHFFETKSTSGADQSEPMIQYTALNYQRMKRLDKTLKISEQKIEKLQKLNQEVTWLVLTEAWCGDAAQVIPMLNKLAEASQNIELKLVYRDEHPHLMDAFLTNGARSIPKLIALNSRHELLYTWGPRPSEATKMVSDYKAKHGSLSEEFKQDLQLWYNKDKGQAIISDQLQLLIEK